MITIKTGQEISHMRKAGVIVKDVLELLRDYVKPGITTRRLDSLAYEYIKKSGASPSFLGYGGFPSSICTSIDEQVVHGIPSNRVLREGELLKVDAGACINGYHADAARTFFVGEVSSEKRLLAEVCESSFFQAIKIVRPGIRIGDIGYTIQKHVEAHGFSVVRELVGHGIGKQLHEDPSVPNYGIPNRGIRILQNFTLAVEPMINMGAHGVKTLSDNWTVVTIDGEPSAHYENTILVTEDSVDILTL